MENAFFLVFILYSGVGENVLFLAKIFHSEVGYSKLENVLCSG